MAAPPTAIRLGVVVDAGVVDGGDVLVARNLAGRCGVSPIEDPLPS